MKKNTHLRPISIVLGYVFFLVFLVVVFIFYSANFVKYIVKHVDKYTNAPQSQFKPQSQSRFQNVMKVLSSDGSVFGYKIILSDTPELRTKGLGGRQALGTDEVMLFVFNDPSKNNFWMKDMLFAIDIVWVNENKEVIYIEKNISPETFPKSFGPDENSKYVLEFKAGVIDSVGIKIGDSVSF